MTDHAHLKSLWRNQEEDPFVMSLSDIHARAETFQSRVRVRNLVEYVAAAVVIVAFGAVALVVPDLVVRLGAALLALGVLVVCWKLATIARAARHEDRAHASSLAAFHRAELQRQRAALSSVWRWYIAPLVPGVVVFIGGVALAMPAPLSAKLALFASALGFTAIIFGAVIALNHWAVKRIDAELVGLGEGE